MFIALHPEDTVQLLSLLGKHQENHVVQGLKLFYISHAFCLISNHRFNIYRVVLLVIKMLLNNTLRVERDLLDDCLTGVQK